MVTKGKSRWEDLSIAEKGDVMGVYIKHGIYDIGVMRDSYNNMSDGGSSKEYAEGGSMDYDPGHPYHYHNAEGKKVVIEPEVWEKYKDKEWFAEYRKAVEDEIAKHPGPEYEVDEEYSRELKKAVEQSRKEWKNGGFENWRNYGSAMPEGYSIDENGIVYDKSGNAYVQPQFNDSRFTYASGEPVKVVYNEGKPIEKEVSYYPMEMHMVEKKPLPVDMVVGEKEIEEARTKAEDDYVARHSFYYAPWLGNGIYDPGKDKVVTFDEYRRSYPFKGDTIYDSKSGTALYGDTNNRPFLTYDQFVRGLSKIMDSVGWNNNDNRDYLMESYINNFPDEYKNRREPSKSKVKQNVKAPLYGEGGHLYQDGGNANEGIGSLNKYMLGHIYKGNTFDDIVKDNKLFSKNFTPQQLDIAKNVYLERKKNEVGKQFLEEVHSRENGQNKGLHVTNTGDTLWYPYDSYEKGEQTIYDGLKLLKGEEVTDMVNKQGYLTNDQGKSLVGKAYDKNYDRAKRVYNKRIGNNTAWDELTPAEQNILVDYSFNGVLPQFKSFMEGMRSKDISKMKEHYKRYSGEKELKQRNEWTYNELKKIYGDKW